MYKYGSDFYQFLSTFAVRSARRIVSELTAVLPIGSVVDFGCGQGAWLSVWAESGAAVTGVDGPYVDPGRLLIEPDKFLRMDLAEPIDLGRTFDLVQSLEVAEHLPKSKAPQFVDTLIRHGTMILFSAAVPGQGGEHHVNEQPLEYWRRHFAARDYIAIDYLRPRVHDDTAVERWYRYNTLLYVRADRVDGLPAELRMRRVPDDQALANYWPFPDRMRNALVRCLPVGTVDRLARYRARQLAHRLASARGTPAAP
jgi:SAM-dependent methyltransferase